MNMQVYMYMYMFVYVDVQRWHCSKTTLTGESWFHISPPQGIWTQVPCDGKQRVTPLDHWDMVRMKWDCRLSTGLPPSSCVSCEAGRRTCSERETGKEKLCEIKWDGLSHCRHEGLVTVWDEARLRRGCNDDQSRWGHQCNETTLIGESRFHISPPRRFLNPGPLWWEAKG